MPFELFHCQVHFDKGSQGQTLCDQPLWLPPDFLTRATLQHHGHDTKEVTDIQIGTRTRHALPRSQQAPSMLLWSGFRSPRSQRPGLSQAL